MQNILVISNGSQRLTQCIPHSDHASGSTGNQNSVKIMLKFTSFTSSHQFLQDKEGSTEKSIVQVTFREQSSAAKAYCHW